MTPLRSPAGVLAAAAALSPLGSVGALPAPQRAWASCRPFHGPEGCKVHMNETHVPDEAIAWGTYMPAGEGGWPQLEVTARTAARSRGVSAATTLEEEFFAVGVVEGALTCRDIEAYWFNVWWATKPPSPEAWRFIKDQDNFVRSEAKRLADNDDYWHSVLMVLAQFDGLLHGYNTYCPEQRLIDLELLFLNLDGDNFDIASAFPLGEDVPQFNPDPQLLYASRPRPRRKATDRCSALFKVLPDYSDIFWGHDTWDTFSTAGPRIFKTYTLPVRREGEIISHVNAFPSSPGYVWSMDDYYTLSGTSQLAVIETSLSINDNASYQALSPRTVPCWIRTMVANMLAKSAEDWTSQFSKMHSGTYNDQWMVLDLAVFGGEGLPDGAFWVLEEAPGAIVAQDMSWKLRKDLYWASYNVAYFSKIRKVINESESWTETGRARLFREMQGSVQNVDDMKRVMGWNDYKHSNISAGDPGMAIMARDDLTKGGGEAHGGIDAKISSYSLYTSGMVTIGRVGPTHDQVPVFCWNTSVLIKPRPHRGQPECFNFTWEPLWVGRSDPGAATTIPPIKVERSSGHLFV